jgi:hypothetical protein
MGICETGGKTFVIAKEALLILLMIRPAAESPIAIVERILEIAVRTGVLEEEIIKIVGEIGVITKGIFRATGITEVITEEASGVIVVTDAITEEISEITGGTEVNTEEIFRATEDTEVNTEEIFRATEDTGDIIKRISELIAKLHGITNDIIPHGQIIGSDILPSVTGINIQVDHTEEEAGVMLTDVRFFPI